MKTSLAGNCGEYAMMLMNYFRKRGISAEKFGVGDHTVVVIGRKEGSNPARPETWGDQAVICDPLNSKPYYLASQVGEFFKTFQSNSKEEKPNVYSKYENEDFELHFSIPATQDINYQQSLIKQTINRLSIIKKIGDHYITDFLIKDKFTDLIKEASKYNVGQKIDVQAEIELNRFIRQALNLIEANIGEEKIEEARQKLTQVMNIYINTYGSEIERKEFHENLENDTGGEHTSEIKRQMRH